MADPRLSRANTWSLGAGGKTWVTGSSYISAGEFSSQKQTNLAEVYDPIPKAAAARSAKSNPFTTHFYAPKEQLTEEVAKHSGVRKVAIIGGGVAGVMTARVFLDEGIDVVLYECTDKLGGVWSENYVGFGIQVPSALYEFPDDPLPEGWDFCAGGMIGNYVQQYAQKHGVTEVAQLNSRIQQISGSSDQGYQLTIEQDGVESTAQFDLVIVATGVYGKQDKFIPNWQGSSNFKGKIIHCADYLDLDVSKDKHVISVGYGKSAFDCAQISTKMGKSSTMLFREAHWCVPRKILGLVPFEYATFSRFGAACLQPAYVASGPFEKVLHGIPGFLDGFWWLVGNIFKNQFGMPEQCVPEKGFIADFWGGHGILPHPNFFPMVKSGKINAKKGEIKEIKAESVVLASGEELPCDVIVAATGYKPVRSYLPKEIVDLKEKDGFWLYRQMIHPDHPNLVFLNSEVTTFTNITTPSIQARWLVELLAGRHKLPSKEGMRADIKKMQDWKRSKMPNAGGARAYMIQTHQIHYYDQLLKDMGASVRRKTGNMFMRAIKEIFDPYRPRDFKYIVTGEFKYRPGEHGLKSQRSFAKEGVLFLIAAILAKALLSVLARGVKVSMHENRTRAMLATLTCILLPFLATRR